MDFSLVTSELRYTAHPSTAEIDPARSTDSFLRACSAVPAGYASLIH